MIVRITPRLVCALASFALLTGCEDAAKSLALENPALAGVVKTKAAEEQLQTAVDEWAQIPMPPADGPRLAALALVTPVHPKPDKSAEPIGYLRLGARVPRSEQAVSKRDCVGGWYAVRPVGFVCVGEYATLKLDHPLVRALDVEPDRSKPMPYKYAFVRSIAPNYLRVPTKDQQFQYEMRLERHLRNHTKLSHKWDALDVGANDVPLDKNGIAIGKIPEHALPMDLSQRFGGNGNDEIPWWLKGGDRQIPNVSSFKAPAYAVIANRLPRHAGVALVGTFVAGEEAQNRRFAITTDARLIPADKLKADSGSPFHGYDIREVGLPVAFAREAGATWWDYEDGKLERGESLGWREFVALTGETRMLHGVRMVEARNGRWLKRSDLKVAPKNSKLPHFARKGTKWIEVSIVNQTMVFWEGDTPIYATLVSTGRDGLGEPGKTLSTPRGTFRIYQKHVTTTMDSDVADHEFELRDVPWVMYFKGGYALHAAYWHDDFGRTRSHGCINVAPIDARYTFEWATPEVPEHWHAAYASDVTNKGTLVYIQP